MPRIVDGASHSLYSRRLPRGNRRSACCGSWPALACFRPTRMRRPSFSPNATERWTSCPRTSAISARSGAQAARRSDCSLSTRSRIFAWAASLRRPAPPPNRLRALQHPVNALKPDSQSRMYGLVPGSPRPAPAQPREPPGCVALFVSVGRWLPDSSCSRSERRARTDASRAHRRRRAKCLAAAAGHHPC
jgi:hypothetical protein